MTWQMFKRITLSKKALSILFIAAVMAAVTVVPTFSGGATGGTAIAAAVAPFVAGEPAILVPGGQLTGRLYVLADGTISTEQPGVPTTAHSGGTAQTFAASITILPARLIKVSGEGRIVEIWSNAKVTTFGFFVLTVKSAETGFEIPLTQAIATQYNEMRGKIEWGRAGKVVTQGIPVTTPE